MKRAITYAVVLVALFLIGLGVVRHVIHAGRAGQLLGLWSLGDARGPADELRFYYFHKGGKGLYRYGQVAFNKTNSFDWSLDGDDLTLTFRKTGEVARTRVHLGEDSGRRTLTLDDDPRGPGRVRYRLTPSSLDVEGGPLALEGDAATQEVAAIAGRMWIEQRRYATGGMGFAIYQLSDHDGARGWKIGWHHAGDFDDWSTESLAYRQEPGAVRLRFTLRGEEQVTPVELRPARDTRVLTMTRDPRNFLHVTKLVDAGRSF